MLPKQRISVPVDCFTGAPSREFAMSYYSKNAEGLLSHRSSPPTEITVNQPQQPMEISVVLLEKTQQTERILCLGRGILRGYM